jgi:hypothetical protein
VCFQVWTELNKDWLVKQEEKDKLTAARAAAGIVPRVKGPRKPKIDHSASTGEPRAHTIPTHTLIHSFISLLAVQALKNVMEEKKISSKVNYSALDGLFTEKAASTKKIEEEAADPKFLPYGLLSPLHLFIGTHRRLLHRHPPSRSS